MTAKLPKGIVSPWARKAADVRPVAPPEPWKTERDDMEVVERDSVRFPGRMRAIHLRPLHGKDEPEQRALVCLGKALTELLAKVPEARAVFDKQSLSFSPLVKTHIVIDLGGVPFYAGTTTGDPDVARRMAVDRIAFALTECSARFPKAKDMLKKHLVEVSNT